MDTAASTDAPASGDFDFACLDTLTLAEKGVPWRPVNPKTFKPLMVAKDTPLEIGLLGWRSGLITDARHRLQERLDARPLGAPPLTPDENRAHNAEIMAAAVTHWNFTLLDGKPFPCTRANALKLLSDPRFEWVLAGAIAFSKDDGNFLAWGAFGASTGPADSSPSTRP